MSRLFVINQETPLGKLRRLMDLARNEMQTVLCSHRPLPSEAACFDGGRRHLTVVEFSDLLSDSDNSECDSIATKEALSHGNGNAWLFARMLWHKNRLAHSRLGEFDCIHYTDGLGVDGRYWCSVGGKPLRRSAASFVRNASHRVEEALRGSKGSDHLIRHDGQAVLFHGPISRLAIDHSTSCEVIPLDSRESVAAARAIIDGRPLLRATTMHYSTPLITNNQDVLVCSDGYHPTNYPRSYLTGLEGRTLVPRDMFDDSWFRSHGLRTRPPFPFLRREFMQPVKMGRAPAVVVLVLNHAGDWTAQVNRSDTDRLLLSFAECASKLPELRFRVRPHPTMRHPRHEGVSSIRRIGEFLCRFKPPIELSSNPLEVDLEEGDIFVSEYSNVLIEAWKRGKLGLSANLTGRRNFMQSYIDLGFPNADTTESLIDGISDAARDPSFGDRLQCAFDRYNSLLGAFLGTKG